MQRREKKSTALKPSMSEGQKKKSFSYHLTQHTTRGHFTSLYSLNSTNIFHIENPGQKWPERNSTELYASLPCGFLSCKSDFSQHPPSRAVRYRFNGPNPSCCHSEQDSGSAHVTAQVAGPWQLTPIHLSYVKEPYILSNSGKNKLLLTNAVMLFFFSCRIVIGKVLNDVFTTLLKDCFKPTVYSTGLLGLEK